MCPWLNRGINVDLQPHQPSEVAEVDVFSVLTDSIFARPELEPPGIRLFVELSDAVLFDLRNLFGMTSCRLLLKDAIEERVGRLLDCVHGHQDHPCANGADFYQPIRPFP
jgi:hypothetical protein